MKKALLITLIFSLIFVSALAYSQPINTTNYTVSSNSQGMSITQLKYTPYPANPGEYVDIWIKAQSYGTNSPSNATFILEPKFPFSLDPNQSAMQSFGNIGSNTIVMHYKVRISKDAVPGDNELDLAYSSDGSRNVLFITPLDVNIQDAQTDFSLVIQDSSSSGTSIGIANTGENTANSLIVKIPQQPNFRVTGVTNGQILGNLNSGDYTLATFQITPTNRNNDTLVVELDYTDAIGVRRTVMKDIQFGATGEISSNSTGTARSQVYGSFAINGQRFNSRKESIASNPWFWTVIGIVVLIGIFSGYMTYKRKNHISNFKDVIKGIRERKSKKTKEKESSKEPDWVTAERAKKGK